MHFNIMLEIGNVFFYEKASLTTILGFIQGYRECYEHK